MQGLPEHIKELVTNFEPQKKELIQAKKSKTKYRRVKSCKKKILVADDMKFIVVAMESLLKNVFKISDLVTFCRDGQQVVDYVTSNLEEQRHENYQPYSLLILDYNMPYLDGMEVVQNLKKLDWKKYNQEVPYVVFQTSNQDPDFRDECVKQGVNCFIEKPVSEERLAAVLIEQGFIKRASDKDSKKEKTPVGKTK